MQRADAWQRVYFNVLMAGSLLFLFTTAFFPAGLPFPGAASVLRFKFNLTGENGFGAWWSGMLLLLGAVHAFDACLRHRDSDRRQAFGWAAFAIVMALLSMDEVGSLHERAGPLLVPFGAVFAVLAATALLTLLHSAVPFRHVFLLGFAFALFGGVAGQEYLQHNSQWWGDNDGLRAGLEEGTELVAMLIIIWVTSRHGHAEGHAHRSTPFHSLLGARTGLVYAVIIGAALLSWFSAGLDDQRGNPAMWVASAAFMLNALGFITLALQEGRLPLRRAALIGGSLAASMATGAFMPPFMASPGAPRLILSHAVFMWCTLMLAAALWWRPQSRIVEGRWMLGLAAMMWAYMPFATTGWTDLGYGLIAACMLRVSGYTPDMVEHSRHAHPVKALKTA